LSPRLWAVPLSLALGVAGGTAGDADHGTTS
jgi:hypothetical protein